MCSLFVIVIFTTTLLYPRTSKTSPNLLDLRSKFWTLIFPTIWTLLTLVMAASERGCCVPKCGRKRKDDTVLHSFPNPDKDMDRYHAWVQAIGMETTLDPHYVYRNRRVCHLHFDTKYLTWSRRLSPDAIPTLLVPGSEIVRLPLANVTNQIDNVVLDDPLPSTSRGPEMAINLLSEEPVKYMSENDLQDAAIPATSQYYF